MTLILIIITVILVLILVALFQLTSLLREEHSRTSEHTLRVPDDIKELLLEISAALDGKEKRRSEIKKERHELKERVVKALIGMGTSKEKAEESAEENFQKAARDEERYGVSNHYLSLEKWVKEQEVDNLDRKSYGNLLDRARVFVGDTDKFKEKDLENELGTDYLGRNWLLKHLKLEGLVEPVTKVGSDGETAETGEWMVVKK